MRLYHQDITWWKYAKNHINTEFGFIDKIHQDLMRKKSALIWSKLIIQKFFKHPLAKEDLIICIFIKHPSAKGDEDERVSPPCGVPLFHG